MADSGNNRVQKFDSGGYYLSQWGSLGSGNTQFNNPVAVAAGRQGHVVYVADQGNNRVQKFDSNGNYLGSLNGLFNSPSGVAVDRGGNVFVVDGFSKVKKFDINGNYLTQLGDYFSLAGPIKVAVDGMGNVYVTDWAFNTIQKFSSSGAFMGSYVPAGGQFYMPEGVAVDSRGNLYVADGISGRILSFGPAVVAGAPILNLLLD